MTSYTLVLTDGSFDQFIPEDQTVSTHGLVFTGRGATNYGEARNENILHLAENFANVTGPTDPLTGQLWWDTGAGALNVWDGTTWVSVSVDEHILSGSYPVVGDPGTVTVTKNIAGPIPLISNALQATTLANHLVTTAAHAATAIQFTPSGSVTGANVQLAIESLDSNIDAHIADASAAHAASAISFTPYLTITGTNVQTALGQVDTDRDSIDTQIDTVSTDLTNHINDTVDAHDASAISFVPGGSGLVSVNVQDAIDEIQASTGTPGALETLQARPSSTQAIGTAFTQILFQTVQHGNALAQWNTGTSTYTAAFDQEVNIIFQMQFVIANNREAFMEIRNGGTVLRNSRITNFDNDAGASGVEITQQREIGVKARLNAGNQVRFFASINPGSGLHNTQSTATSCHIQFEVVRDLS